MTAVGIQWGFTGEGRYAHGGMLRAAQVMRLELHESQVLQHVYGAKGRSDGGREVSDKKAELRVPLVSTDTHVGYKAYQHANIKYHYFISPYVTTFVSISIRVANSNTTA